jgi:hypothetical protein
MAGMQLKTPVVLLVFNRPTHSEQVFSAVRRVQPERLLIVADGPRPGREGEATKCEQVREIVTAVDWDCEVLTNFAETNLGCAERVISGLTWVFEQTDSAIILEDDCLPGHDFFRFCEELIPRYKDDDRIGSITGTNFCGPSPVPYSYHFSQISDVWGWASWRSSWQRYDRSLKDWPTIKASKFLFEIFQDEALVEYWIKIFDMMYSQKPERQITWDYQWYYSNLINNCLTVMPTENLVKNIGFDPEATHTFASPGYQLPEIGRIEFPLRHPPGMVPIRSLDRRVQQTLFLRPATADRSFRKLLPQWKEFFRAGTKKAMSKLLHLDESK